MGQFKEYVRMALNNIRSNKGRTFLTMLGIIIGIASVIMIMTIGNGVKRTMNSDLGDIIGGQMVIYSNYELSELSFNLTQDDLLAVQEIKGVKAATPMMSASGSVSAYKGDFSVSITAGNESLSEINKLTMVYGRYFTKQEVDSNSAVAVIKTDDAKKMFGTDDVAGLTMEINSSGQIMDVTIVGVGKSKQAGALTTTMMGTDDSVTVYMPYTALKKLGMSTDTFSSINLIAADSKEESSVGDAALAVVNDNHPLGDEYGSKKAFLIEKGSSSIETIDSVLNKMTLFIAIVAAISLLVGGIGIMNIMLVSVTERTKEIGIRKALGAKTGSIITQFLAESAIISGIGGIIGIIIGVSLALLVCTIIKISPAVSIMTIILATLFSCGVGILFGVYPARKAAHLNPIDALRKE